MWRPLLAEDVREHAVAAAREVGRAIVAAPWEQLAAELPDRARGDRAAGLVDLGRGRAGGALLLDRLGRAESARALIQTSIDAIDELDPGFVAGYTGVAWVAQALEGATLDAGEAEPLCEQVDAAVLEALASWRGEHDLVDGLVGIGVYCAARLPRPAAHAGLARVVRELAAHAVHDAAGARWPSAPGEPALFDVGLAHGAAGAIALLARALDIAEARPLLDDAVRWLRALDRADEPQRFPGKVLANGQRLAGRHGWCYGDLGIAAALYGAGVRARRDDWCAHALDVARTAAQLHPADTAVHDAGLCHGSAGCGHIFNRLYQATGDPACARAARTWFAHALALRNASGDVGIAGFLASGTRRSPGLLAGATGTALALLAAATDVEPRWDEVLLLA